jgi:HNH endonuclease
VNKHELTVERARELLSYDPETGELRWKPRAGSRGTRAGKFAGSVQQPGHGRTQPYLYVYVDGRHYRAHRLVWLIVHGRWPAEQIDHINRNGLDNRLSNLREADQSQNNCNRPPQHTKQLAGIKGVYARPRKGWTAYQAIVMLNGKNVWSRTFHTLTEAVEQYRLAASRYHGEYSSALLSGAKSLAMLAKEGEK